MNKHIIESIITVARWGWKPSPEDVRELLALNYETQAQAAYRIGADPRTIRRAASESDPYRLNAHAWALLRLSYLLEAEADDLREALATAELGGRR